jgi:hypothetical protein
MDNLGKGTKNIHPLIVDIEKELWWNLDGCFEGWSAKRTENELIAITLTATNKKGVKYYFRVTGHNMGQALDLAQYFIETGDKTIGKWRKSKW